MAWFSSGWNAPGSGSGGTGGGTCNCDPTVLQQYVNKCNTAKTAAEKAKLDADTAKAAAEQVKAECDIVLQQMKDLLANFNPGTPGTGNSWPGISAKLENIIQLESDGIYAEGYPGISKAADNSLELKADGLYTPPVGTVTSSSEIDGGSAFSEFLNEQQIGGGNAGE